MSVTPSDAATVTIWSEGRPSEHQAASVDEARRLISSQDEFVWVDIPAGFPQVESFLGLLAIGCPELRGLDSEKATRVELDPTERPPKAKTFRGFIFARSYWLLVDWRDHEIEPRTRRSNFAANRFTFLLERHSPSLFGSSALNGTSMNWERGQGTSLGRPSTRGLRMRRC